MSPTLLKSCCPLHPPNVKMKCTLSKNQCHLNQYCSPYFPYFPSRTFTALKVRGSVVETTSFPRHFHVRGSVDQWISGSVDQWSRPRHFHVISTSFPRHFHLSNKKKFYDPIFFPYFVSHTFLKILWCPT